MHSFIIQLLYCLCRYAICGDQTIRKIALTRPSTKARLANINGVNQVTLQCFEDVCKLDQP